MWKVVLGVGGAAILASALGNQQRLGAFTGYQPVQAQQVRRILLLAAAACLGAD